MLQAAGGTYYRGAPPDGLNVLVTLRDGNGAGPADPWIVRLFAPGSTTPVELVYEDASPGSFSAWWWEGVAPLAGEYVVEAVRAGAGSGPEDGDTSGGTTLTTELTVDPDVVLNVPILELDLVAGALTWTGAENAGSFLCRVFDAQGSVVVYSLTPSRSCTVSALPPGSYRAEVLAHSIDHLAIAADLTATPLDGAPHLLSHAEVQFSLPEPGGTAVVVRVAGGGLAYGPALPGLALWLSVTGDTGGGPAEEVAVEVTGPGIPEATPLFATYPAGAAERIFWDYLAVPMPGAYSAHLTAVALGLDFFVAFEAPAQDLLPEPAGLVVLPAPSGAADVSFDAVPGAVAYLVSAWTTIGATYALVAEAWTTATAYTFPAQTFTSGASYDVYVLCSTLDPSDGDLAAPPSVQLSENTLSPETFVAP